MSTSTAQLLPHIRCFLTTLLLLVSLPSLSLSSETPIAEPSSRLRGAIVQVVQVTSNYTLVLPADADGCSPCDPLSRYPVPVCFCIAGNAMCGQVEAACDDSNSVVSSSTQHDSLILLPTKMVNGKQLEYGRTCYKRSCVQLKCSPESPPSSSLKPNFCPLLASTWVDSPSPFVSLTPADPFCGPGAYLQCTRSPEPPDPIGERLRRPSETLDYLFELAGLFCNTHPLWAFVSSPIWVLLLLLGSFLSAIYMFLVIMFSFVFPLLRFLYRVIGEFSEDMPFIAIAITVVVSILVIARLARNRYRRAAFARSSPRTE